MDRSEDSQTEKLVEDRLLLATLDVLNPFRAGGLMARVTKAFGITVIFGGLAAVLALPETYSKVTAFGLVVTTFAAGVSASYRHRKRLEELDSEEARERREIQRCARALLMEYDRIRQRELFPSAIFGLDQFQALAKPLRSYRDSISSASYYSEASLHGEACSLVLAALEAVALPGIPVAMFTEGMEKIRSLMT